MPVDEVSIGDYVLAGGEAAVLVIVEAVARLLPGFLGNPDSLAEESHAGGLLEYPVYTRPPTWRGLEVPGVLLSGDHGAVARWRRDESLRRTAARRPDLLAGADLSRTGQSRPGLTPGFAMPEAVWHPGRVVAGRSGPDAPDREPPARASACPSYEGSAEMNTLDALDAESLRTDVPDFRPGDTLKVHVRVVEGSRERIQLFQGVVIRRQGSGVRETFTVRKVSFGVGVERTFPVHTPIIQKIEVATRGDVRRAKLYYLRDLRGKAAKIKEKRDPIAR